MTQFSSIEAETVEETAPSTEKPIVTAPDANSTVGAKGMGVPGFIQHLGRKREIPKVPTSTSVEGDGLAPEGPDAPINPDEQASLDANRSWFDRVFGKKKDGPGEVELDAELDSEMYQMSGTIGSEVTDEILPRLINSMHGEEDHKAYQATPTQKEGLAKAWELYLRSIKQRISPLAYLITKIAVVYGGAFFGGIFVYINRISRYGFHFPWSDSWKDQPKMAVVHSQEPAPSPAPEPAPEPDPPPPDPPEPEAPTIKMQSDLYKPEQEFIPGEGFPKTSKNQKALIGMFASHSNFIAYCNANGLMGKKAKA